MVIHAGRVLIDRFDALGKTFSQTVRHTPNTNKETPTNISIDSLLFQVSFNRLNVIRKREKLNADDDSENVCILVGLLPLHGFFIDLKSHARIVVMMI